jgi:hypothetical protein
VVFPAHARTAQGVLNCAKMWNRSKFVGRARGNAESEVIAVPDSSHYLASNEANYEGCLRFRAFGDNAMVLDVVADVWSILRM